MDGTVNVIDLTVSSKDGARNTSPAVYFRTHCAPPPTLPIVLYGRENRSLCVKERA
jgi:hypothetical protein